MAKKAQKQAPCGAWVAGDNEYEAATKLDNHIQSCNNAACNIDNAIRAADFGENDN